jgi:hypothetical protein
MSDDRDRDQQAKAADEIFHAHDSGVNRGSIPSGLPLSIKLVNQ